MAELEGSKAKFQFLIGKLLTLGCTSQQRFGVRVSIPYR